MTKRIFTIICLIYYSSICFGNQIAADLLALKNTQTAINKSRYRYLKGQIVVYDEAFTEVPKLQIIPFNTSIENKDACIVSFATLNKPYDKLFILLLDSLKSRFIGHVLFREGGWPNFDQGCYAHATSAYAFKACAIQEAYDLGYKKVLWVDSTMVATKDLAPLFKCLDEQPCLYRYSSYSFKGQINKCLLNEFQLKNFNCRHIASGVLGFNFNVPACREALRIWHEKTKKNLSWPRNFPEQLLISIVFNQLQLDRYAFKGRLIKLGFKDTGGGFFRVLRAQERRYMHKKIIDNQNKLSQHVNINAYEQL